MKIAQSAIQLFSKRTAIQKQQKSESLIFWKDSETERSRQSTDGGQGLELDVQKGLATLAQSTKVNLSEQAVRSRTVSSVDIAPAAEMKLQLDLNLRILSAMIERITGNKVRIIDREPASPVEPGAVVQSTGEAVAGDNEVTQEVSQGGLIYDSFESNYEFESTSFSASGKILTIDGQKIDFSVDLNMSREFYSEEHISIRAGDALQDPLVINFQGLAAQLSETKFSFDIDNNGQENQISNLTPGSGFLALDKNQDGTINNGSELFGPESGNGFQDLAAYDSDGNNWIDENDSIFNKLRIWVRDEQGNNSLFALGEKGIGAIYLGSTETLFSMKDSQNNLLGELQSTGLFVRENGGVGTVQQVDLVA